MLLGVAAPAARADLMIIGLDEKVTFDAEGNRAFVAPGKESIVVVDIANREAPRIVATFPRARTAGTGSATAAWPC